MKFEHAGRRIDREIVKMVEYLENKVKPATRQEMAKLLRSASERLSKLAEKVEKTES